MDYFQNIVEYYDELFPANNQIIDLFKNYQKDFNSPLKVLSIGCATGVLESNLAKNGFDVTGLEVSQPLLDSACLKHKNQLQSLRFFKLSSVKMVNFLGKNFYNVITILNDRVIFTTTPSFFKSTLKDCYSLLSENGTLIIQTLDYQKILAQGKNPFIVKKSIRCTLKNNVISINNNSFLTQTLETPSKKYTVLNKQMVYTKTKKYINKYAKEIGYKSIQFYSSFNLDPVTSQTNEVIIVLKK